VGETPDLVHEDNLDQQCDITPIEGDPMDNQTFHESEKDEVPEFENENEGGNWGHN
jgi:hypothetical protein